MTGVRGESRKVDWMIRCRAVIACSILFFLALPREVSAAQSLLEDTFQDCTKIDLCLTTAQVDTAAGWVTLGKKSLGKPFALHENSYDITVINGSSIETYRYNGTNMEEKTEFLITGLLDPTAVSASGEESLVVLDKNAQRASTYQYDGSAMMENYSLRITELANPLSVACIPNVEEFCVLEGEGIKRYCFDGQGMVKNSQLGVDFAPKDYPTSFAVKPDGLGYAVIDKATRQIRFYSFNGSSFTINSPMSITDPTELVNPRDISLFWEGTSYAVLDENQVIVYSFDGQEMVFNPALSVGGLKSPLALAVRPGSYDYAVMELGENGRPQIRCFGFNGSAMEEIPQLGITGLKTIPYANDQVLMGKGVTSPESVSVLKLVADVDLPEGTSITWEVTVDGELWKKADNSGGTVKFTKTGTKPNYRALLHTDNPYLAPKIFQVRLIDASLGIGNFRVTEITGPAIPGNPMLPTDEQVNVWAGHNVSFQIDTRGCVESIAADIEFLDERLSLNSILGSLTPVHYPGEYYNTWEGTFYTAGDIPKNTLLDIYCTAKRETEQVNFFYPGFAVIFGSAYESHRVHLTH